METRKSYVADFPGSAQQMILKKADLLDFKWVE